MYLFLENPHPTANKAQEGLKKPRRAPVPPVQPHRDRKKDYVRSPKHKEKV